MSLWTCYNFKQIYGLYTGCRKTSRYWKTTGVIPLLNLCVSIFFSILIKAVSRKV